jgi:hypothetical protein
VIPVAIASVPVFLLVLFLGFVGRNQKASVGWRGWRVPFLVLFCAICFGGYVSHVLVPGLSANLSSKYAVESYQRFKKGDEPLGVYGKGGHILNAKTLSRKEVNTWLQRDDRVFVLFPPDNLATFSRTFRKKTGRHIPVLDATNEKFMLATSKLIQKEKNQNPIMAFVQDKPFSPGPSHAENVNFEDKVTLVGWDIVNESGGPELIIGKDAIITTYWRCDGRGLRNNKIFMHIDGPGGRLHGDHDPLDNLYPTGKWDEGDYIKDVYKLSVPLYQKPGKYSVRMGLFKGSTRLKIQGHPKAKKNSVWIASVVVK